MLLTLIAFTAFVCHGYIRKNRCISREARARSLEYFSFGTMCCLPYLMTSMKKKLHFVSLCHSDKQRGERLNNPASYFTLCALPKWKIRNEKKIVSFFALFFILRFALIILSDQKKNMIISILSSWMTSKVRTIWEGHKNSKKIFLRLEEEFFQILWLSPNILTLLMYSIQNCLEVVSQFFT